MRFDIHHWLNHRWAYPNFPPVKLFKGYINATYGLFHQKVLNRLNLTDTEK